jgi:small subunit ribosomal protein S9
MKMKKAEVKKEKKEIKKKPVPAAKKAAPKVKKEVKKVLPEKKAVKAEAPEVQETKTKKVHEEAPKIEQPKHVHAHAESSHVEKTPATIIEEHKAAPIKKKPARVVQYHGTGGRKTSGARVWISQGTGKYNINGKPLDIYICKRHLLSKMAMEPFVATNTIGKFDVYANAIGGGICSQVGAVRQGLSEALIQFNPEFRSTLKKLGLLTRDPRMKERKKFGQKRARKRFQYSKR